MRQIAERNRAKWRNEIAPNGGTESRQMAERKIYNADYHKLTFRAKQACYAIKHLKTERKYLHI
ncbi:MAG: hypothetical protein J6J20_04160 [Muribaculaceae bacterium]|nr:hypothetical protein [Muribaculaceae bacterium]